MLKTVNKGVSKSNAIIYEIKEYFQAGFAIKQTIKEEWDIYLNVGQ